MAFSDPFSSATIAIQIRGGRNFGGRNFVFVPVLLSSLSGRPGLTLACSLLFSDWKGAFLRAANVTLDPRTAHPCLELSLDGKALSNTGPRPALPAAPGRFDVYACVLGAEGYTAGTHFWDVQVPGAGGWALGVTRASAGRKGRVPFSPEHGTWAIQLSMGQYRALSAEWIPLAPPRHPGKIRVYLDYEGGVVAFYDAETTAPLHAFSASFHGPILPFFWVWSAGTSLRLCPPPGLPAAVAIQETTAYHIERYSVPILQAADP
nr:butyrophilin subfamily 1 member A1-like [Pelodiscus sinensis]|eukprot:XP_025036870.1 butyrophilin subfamily 1 member A1-like [Pelodiscus sinensis]